MHDVIETPPIQRDARGARRTTARPLLCSRWADAAFISLMGLFVYLQVFALPWTPRAATGDQAIYLQNATRMLEGEVIYRDYDHFTFPGTDVLYMILFRVLGIHGWIPQAMLVGIAVLLAGLILVISRQLMSGVIAYLPSTLFITLPLSGYLDATHHWFGVAATIAALAVFLRERSAGRLLAGGALLGIGAFFTQSLALITVGVALFLVFEHDGKRDVWQGLVKKEAFLWAGFFVTILTCMAYFVRKAGLKLIVNQTAIFVAKYYPADWFNNWHVYLSGRPQLHAWMTWFDLPAFALIHTIIPLIYVLFFIMYRRRGNEFSQELWNKLVLLNLTGVFLFLTIASAPAYNRLYVVSAPGVVTLAWMIQISRRARPTALMLASIFIGAMLVSRPLLMQFRWRGFLDVPTGRTAFYDPVLYDKCRWVMQRSQASDYVFGDPVISFVLQRRSVTRVSFLRPTEYTRPEEAAEVIRELDKSQVRFVSWYAGLDLDRDAIRHPQGDHLAPVRVYLREHYHLAHTFTNSDQMWERKQQ